MFWNLNHFVSRMFTDKPVKINNIDINVSYVRYPRDTILTVA